MPTTVSLRLTLREKDTPNMSDWVQFTEPPTLLDVSRRHEDELTVRSEEVGKQRGMYNDYLLERSLRYHITERYPKLDKKQQEDFMSRIRAGDEDTLQSATQTGLIMRTLPNSETGGAAGDQTSVPTNDLEVCYLERKALVEARDRVSKAFLLAKGLPETLTPETKYWRASDMLPIAQACSDRANMWPKKWNEELSACRKFLLPDRYSTLITDKGLAHDRMTCCTRWYSQQELDSAYDILCHRLDNKMYPDNTADLIIKSLGAPDNEKVYITKRRLQPESLAMEGDWEHHSSLASDSRSYPRWWWEQKWEKQGVTWPWKPASLESKSYASAETPL